MNSDSVSECGVMFLQRNQILKLEQIRSLLTDDVAQTILQRSINAAIIIIIISMRQQVTLTYFQGARHNHSSLPQRPASDPRGDPSLRSSDTPVGTLKTREWKTGDHEKYGGGKGGTGNAGPNFHG